MCESLEIVGFELDVVFDAVVVSSATGALQNSVRLKVEVGTCWISDTSVDNSAGPEIAIPVCIFGIDCISADVMALPDNKDGQLWALLVGVVDSLKSSVEGRLLVVEDCLVLTLGNAITVHNYLFRLRTLVPSDPEFEALDHHIAKLVDDLLSTLLDADARRPFAEVFIGAGDDGSDARRIVSAGRRRMRDVDTEEDGSIVKRL